MLRAGASSSTSSKRCWRMLSCSLGQHLVEQVAGPLQLERQRHRRLPVAVVVERALGVADQLAAEQKAAGHHADGTRTRFF